MISIVSEEIPAKVYEGLKKYTRKIVFIKKYHLLYRAIQSHADIQCFPLKDNLLVVHPHIDSETLKRLKSFGVDIIFGKTILKEKYPYDIPYNVGKVGEYLFHNFNYTDEIIKEMSKDLYNFIHIKQGYGKCSIIPVGNNALITPDGGIAKKAESIGLATCLIRQGYVQLPFMNYGFIGGACGYIPKENLILFTGDIKLHPDYEKITKFLMEKQTQWASLSDDPVIDIGSIFFI